MERVCLMTTNRSDFYRQLGFTESEVQRLMLRQRNQKHGDLSQSDEETGK